MTSKELLDQLAEMKIPAKSASSALEDAYVSMVKKKLAPVIEARSAEIEAKKIAEQQAAAAEEAAAKAEAEKERIAKPELCGGALLDIGVYPINFARMLFGSEITGITSACVKGETGVDLQSSITFVYRNHRMAVLQMTAFCANDRQGVISGDKGYIIVDNINNPQLAVVYSVNHEEVARYTCPPQITGFEYQVQASIDAIREGKIETPCMPHAETLHIMQMLDDLRSEWGVRYPMD